MRAVPTGQCAGPTESCASASPLLIRHFRYVLFLFFVFSYTLPVPVVSESSTLRKDE
jgi:hypothetical protein